MKGNLHWLLLVASFVARASATEPTFRLVNSTTLWSGRFVGAVTVGDGRVVLAPAAAGCVGVFDPSDAFPSSEFPSPRDCSWGPRNIYYIVNSCRKYDCRGVRNILGGPNRERRWRSGWRTGTRGWKAR